MRFVTIGLLAACMFAAPAFAAVLEVGDREVAIRVSQTDLDLGSIGDFDLGDETMRRYAASIGWMRTSMLQLGVEVSWIDMDLGYLVPYRNAESDGASLGAFLQVNFPTKRRLTPFLGAGFSIFRNDMSELYQWDLDLSAGLKVYPSRRFGFLLAGGWNRLSPEDGVPSASGAEISAGLLFKF